MVKTFLPIIAACIAIGAAATAQTQQRSPLQPPISDNRPLKLGAVTQDRTRVSRYGKIELRVQLEGTCSNAFDPEQIALDVVVTTPRGEKLSVPGFFFQDYRREGSENQLTPAGEPGWRIRFAPTQTGKYSVVVTAKDRTGKSVKSKALQFACIASSDPGFVRVSKTDKRYFAFDSGAGYVPIGANVCWSYGRGIGSYDDWLPKYERAGCNYFRLFLGIGWVTFAMERTGEPAERFGAGKIDLANAWRLDYVLDSAARRGMYVMLCFDSFNELRKEVDGAYPYWERTPQNAANGGPIKEPGEFWTNPEMLRLYRNKLRYMVARYGWDPHVLSWEFWNEVDIVSPSAYMPDQVAKWHAEMGNYLRRLDPWKHLITTSFAGSPGKPEIDKLPQMDYVQTHNYGSRDIAGSLTDLQKSKERFGKPHYVGELGIDASFEAGTNALQEIALHNGIWSTLLSGSAGSAMLWWWDNVIDPENLYFHFAALNGFVKGIDFPSQGFRRIENAALDYADPNRPTRYTDLELNGPVSWDPIPANNPVTVSIDSSGKVTSTGEVAGIQHGLINHPDLHNPVTFETDLPHPTSLSVVVTGVSGWGGAHLIARLDDRTALDKEMPDSGGKDHETLNKYDRSYPVEIPAGKHRVVVENTGADWVIASFLIKGVLPQTGPDLRLFGMRGKSTSLLWVQNTRNTWYRVRTIGQPEEQPPSILRIPNWPAGSYHVQFWDTYAGRETSARDVTVGGEGLTLQLPAIQKDLALKVTGN